jgi:hypothetical protein
MIAEVTPIALDKIGWRYYLLFIVCDFTNALFFYLFLPETKGISLEVMDDLFTNSPLLVPGSRWVARPEVDIEMIQERKDILAKAAVVEEVEGR